jgi:uncharacterized protein (DUF1778 family)
MPSRAALLISCSMEEARIIRQRAELQRRGISSYMINILIRAVAIEERTIAGGVSFDRSLYIGSIRAPGPRTAVLLRCSKVESERIRQIAKIRGLTISGFVLFSLRRSWAIERHLLKSHFEPASDYE